VLVRLQEPGEERDGTPYHEQQEHHAADTDEDRGVAGLCAVAEVA